MGILFLAIMLFSCYKEIRFVFIKQGMTTVQVKKLIGKPLVVLNDEGKTIWAYKNVLRNGYGGEYGGYSSTVITGYTDLIYFDAEGKVININRKKEIPVPDSSTKVK